MKHPAKWKMDCQGKQDFDAELVSLSTRYWPRGGGFDVFDATYRIWERNTDRSYIKPAAQAAILLRTADGYLVFTEQDFEADTEAEVKVLVEAWADEQYGKIVEVLTGVYEQPKEP